MLELLDKIQFLLVLKYKLYFFGVFFLPLFCRSPSYFCRKQSSLNLLCQRPHTVAAEKRADPMIE